MATVDSILLEMESLVKDANTLKEMVVKELVEQKLLDSKVGEAFITNYHIVLLKQNWFRYWGGKIMGKDDKGYYYKIVKL